MTETQMIQRYGKHSKQHLQYVAVLDEQTIIDTYGKRSVAHLDHLKYMRKLGIPVIG